MHVVELLIVVSSFLLVVPVAFAQATDKNAAPSERDKAGLRGPVKTVVIETPFEHLGKSTVETVEYTADGRILRRASKFGDDPGWIEINSYDPTGVKVESIFGSGDIPLADRQHTLFTHHEDGRIEARGRNRATVISRIDDHGRRVDIQSYPDMSDKPNAALASSQWFDSTLSLPASSAGRFEITYDRRGLPIEGHSYDSDGKEIARVVRTYDDHNRPVRDEVTGIPVTPGFPAEFLSQLNPEQIHAMASMWASQISGYTSYKYDSRGQLVERQLSGNMRGETVTNFEYNQQGDKTFEHTTSAESPSRGVEYGMTEDGQLIPDRKVPLPPPQVSETRYEYVYDSQGNWTERRINVSYLGQSTPMPQQVIRRTLTYYEGPK